MLNSRFCPKCGKQISESVKGFCKSCFLQEHEILFVDNELKMPICKHCGKIKIKGAWFEKSAKSIDDFLKSKIKLKGITNEKLNINTIPQPDSSYIVQIDVSGNIDGSKIEFSKEILLKPAIELCDPCMRLVSNYHEAILQVRFEQKPSAEQLNKKIEQINKLLEYEKRKDSLAQAIKITEETNGFNVYIGSAKSARRIAEQLAKNANTRVITSAKLTSMDAKTGKANKRLTYCVRI